MTIANKKPASTQSGSALDESTARFKQIYKFMGDVALACLVIFLLSLATTLGWIKD